MAAVDLIKNRIEARGHRRSFLLWPQTWKAYNDTRPKDWKMRRLAKPEKANIPEGPGIYTLLIQPGIANHPAASYIMYVGQAVDLRKRFGDYLTKERLESGRPMIVELLHLYDEYVWFCFCEIAAADLNDVEDKLIQALVPPFNDKMEAEVKRVVGAFS